MEIGVHLPQLDLDGSGLSLQRLRNTVDTARSLGFAAVSANDHLDFAAPWLDGLVALSAASAFAGELELMTSVALPVVRGPVTLATALAGLARFAPGRVVAGVGPGSTARDHALVGKDFDKRWQDFDETVPLLRALLDPTGDRPAGTAVAPAAIPIWIASWGSRAGLRRVARLGDGWVASAYNLTPEMFAEARSRLGEELAAAGRAEPDFPHALVTMWLWLTDDEPEARQVLDGRLGPVLGREPAELQDKVCVGTVDHCIDLLSRYAASGCRRVHVWPLGREADQLTWLASEVLPKVTATPSDG